MRKLTFIIVAFLLTCAVFAQGTTFDYNRVTSFKYDFNKEQYIIDGEKGVDKVVTTFYKESDKVVIKGVRDELVISNVVFVGENNTRFGKARYYSGYNGSIKVNFAISEDRMEVQMGDYVYVFSNKVIIINKI